MKKLKFGSLLVNKGASVYEPFLLKIFSPLVIFPDGENLQDKITEIQEKMTIGNPTGVYIKIVEELPEKPVKDVLYIIDDSTSIADTIKPDEVPDENEEPTNG